MVFFLFEELPQSIAPRVTICNPQEVMNLTKKPILTKVLTSFVVLENCLVDVLKSVKNDIGDLKEIS